MTDKSKSIAAAILHLGKFYPPHRGGIETHVRDLAVRQLGMGPVSVVVANSQRRDESAVLDGVHVTRVASLGVVASMPVCPGLTAAIRRHPADLVHLHTPNPGAAFSFLMSGHRGKLVITHHADTLGRKHLRALSDPFVRRAMQRASVIIVTSGRYLDSSEELRPFREKCRVIPIGIDPRGHGEEGIDGCAELPRRSAKPLVLAVGRMVRYKGFDILIRAMKSIDAELLLIGHGPEALQLQELVAREGIADKVTMLDRVANLRPYLQQASVFVLPSLNRAEAFGIVQLEAMAAGLPVVNTDIDSAVPEISVHGRTGFTVKPGDPEALAGAIRTLVENEELRRRFGVAARAAVDAGYTADLMAERTLSLYREILE